MTATRTRKPKPATPASNVKSHSGTGIVHRGVWIRGWNGEWVEKQACGGSRNLIAYGYPTEAPVTCKRCG